MLFGTVPFKANNMDDLHKLIKQGYFEFPSDASEDAKSLINGLIKVSPKQRLTLPQIFSHPWLKEISDESESSDEEDNAEKKCDCKMAPQNTQNENNNPNQTNDEDVDLKEIGGNINYVNVDNLFFEENYGTKLSYTDY